MANEAARPKLGPPPIPAETVQEGSRWRYHRPSSEQVATWFKTVPLDTEFGDGGHELFVNGVVIIPTGGKVKYQTESGTQDRYEMVYTPYMQIGTRLAYARRLAEMRQLVLRIAPADVPRSDNPQSPYFNGNMARGLWWHIVQARDADGQLGTVRYLCATQTVAFYEREEIAKAKLDGDGRIIWDSIWPVLEGQGTKQVGGGVDENGLMKAQTGAIGRALGTAGILVLGTGIASAEDMQEYTATPAPAPELPSVDHAPTEVPAGPPPQMTMEDREEHLTHFRARALAAKTQLDEMGKSGEFNAWWSQRTQIEGWQGLNDVPLDALEGIVVRLEKDVSDATAVEEAPVQ